MGNVETNETTRPKTTSTAATLSPRTTDSVTVNHFLVNSSGSTPAGTLKAKKRLALPPHTLTVRPQTSPDVVTAKSQAVTNRMQSRLRISKRKAGHSTETNGSIETVEEKPEEMQQTVHEIREESNKNVDILLVSASRSGFNRDNLSEVPKPGYSAGQDVKELESRDRSPRADKQLNEPSPPLRNNRYGNGIKTRLAKLFNKGNTCMEEPEVIEPQRTQDEKQAPYLIPIHNGIHRPSRFEATMYTVSQVLDRRASGCLRVPNFKGNF